MSSPDSPSGNAEHNGQLPQRVAELAGELTEAQEESRRRRLARQISELASRSGQASRRGVAAGTGAAWRGTQSGAGAARRQLRSATGAAARRAGPARDAAGRSVRAGRDIAIQRAQTAGTATRGRVRSSAAATWHGLRAGGEWLAAQAVDMAPRVPIRGIATLQQQHPGLDSDQLADQLIAGAARAAAGIGAAVGAAAAVPFVPTLPMELGVETLALVAVELKLIAELHEVYGQQAPGSARQRMLAYLIAWSQRRGVRLTTDGISLAVGSPVRRQLERRLLAKASQGAFALAPLLTGVAAGAVIDHLETRKLGNAVRRDLRARSAAPER